jgi:hypothetical protein
VFDKVPSNANINISVLGQNNYVDNVTFTANDLFVFLPNNQKAQGYKVDPRVNGRVINYRISSTGYWRMATFALDAKPADRR